MKIINYLQSYRYRKVIYAIIIAIVLRLICIPNKSWDYKGCLSPWYDYIVEHGGFSALKDSFANYTPPYLYWLVIAATILAPLPKIFSIKLLAMMVDFLCAFIVAKIVSLKYPYNDLPLWSFIIVILSPTVIYNSALWGQCDVIYTTGLVAALYFFCRSKQIPALISFGVAFSFKLQAMFLAPFLLILLLRRKITWYYCFLIPVTYLVLIIPAWLAGRPLKELLLIYYDQSNTYHELSKNAPNLYSLISNDFYSIVVPIGLILTVILILCLSYLVFTNKLPLTSDRLIHLAIISVLLMPYCLPKMHERYFYPADIFSIIFAFYFPQYRWVPIVIQLASLISYLGTNILIKFAAIPLGLTLIFLILKNDFFNQKQLPEI